MLSTRREQASCDRKMNYRVRPAIRGEEGSNDHELICMTRLPAHVLASEMVVENGQFAFRIYFPEQPAQSDAPSAEQQRHILKRNLTHAHHHSQ